MFILLSPHRHTTERYYDTETVEQYLAPNNCTDREHHVGLGAPTACTLRTVGVHRTIGLLGQQSPLGICNNTKNTHQDSYRVTHFHIAFSTYTSACPSNRCKPSKAHCTRLHGQRTNLVGCLKHLARGVFRKVVGPAGELPPHTVPRHDHESVGSSGTCRRTKRHARHDQIKHYRRHPCKAARRHHHCWCVSALLSKTFSRWAAGSSSPVGSK